MSLVYVSNVLLFNTTKSSNFKSDFFANEEFGLVKRERYNRDDSMDILHIDDPQCFRALISAGPEGFVCLT